MKYEYSVSHDSELPEPYPRKNFVMTEHEADLFIKEWEEDGGREGAFFKVRRQVGEWEEAK